MNNNRSKLLTGGCWILIACLSCRGSGAQVQELSKHDITVQVAELGEKDGMQIYRVKVNPSAVITATLTPSVKIDLIYHMDSCFYRNVQGKLTYPLMWQYVAAGSEHRFEYLAGFPSGDKTKAQGKLIYKDKFLNKEVYSFKP